jgi:dephospho-CoA kinase
MTIKNNLGGFVPLWLKNKVIIGITGGIASGKTTAANFFHQKGIPIIDADKIGHQILERKEIKEKIISTFGKEIILENKIDRGKLGKIVFQNPKKLRTLNNIIHPILINEILQKIKLSRERTIIIDAALLLDWKLDKLCNYVILITAKKSIQIKRLTTYKNLSNKDAISRISSQKKPIKKRDFIIIENNSTLSEFQDRLENAWNLIKIEIGNLILDNKIQVSSIK